RVHLATEIRNWNSEIDLQASLSQKALNRCTPAREQLSAAGYDASRMQVTLARQRRGQRLRIRPQRVHRNLHTARALLGAKRQARNPRLRMAQVIQLLGADACGNLRQRLVAA